MADYAAALKDDLVEQFRGKPNIDALMEVVGEQLQDLYEFFYDLKARRSIEEAEGAQLDGVGDIVVLSRAEAGQLASKTNPGEAVTDDLYRKFLIYKVLKNTNRCTYPDIIKSFQMFWEKPLYYSEDPDTPATMIFETDTLSPDDAPETLLSAPIIKAAGVAVKVIAKTETPEIELNLYAAAGMGKGYTTTQLPEIEPEYDFDHSERFTAVAHNITKTILPELEEE